MAAETNPSYERHKKVEAKRATENAIQKVANIIAESNTQK